jgi:hypothetical protein
MKKSLAAPVVLLLVLSAAPAGASAAAARRSGQGAHVASVYHVPPPPPATPAAAAHVSASDVAGELSDLSPSALVAKGGVALHAAASGPGALTIVVSAVIHGRAVAIGSGHRIATAAGTVSIELTLTRAGKVALASRTGQLKVTVSVVFRAKHAGKRTASATSTLA